MRLPNGNSDQLLFEKCNRYGIEALTDEEVLSLLCINSLNPEAYAQALLKNYSNFRVMLVQDIHAFITTTSLNANCYYLLQAAREICRRANSIDLNRITLNNPAEIASFLKSQLRDKPNEVFTALFFDIHYQIIGFEILFKGTVNSTTVYIRSIIQRILALNSSAVLFAHNHPSGLCKPSKDDLALTQKLKKTLASIEVQLIDHLIIADNKLFSIINQTFYPA